MSPGYFYELFLNSDISKDFAAGDSGTVAGKSGTELAMKIIAEFIPECVLPKAEMRLERTPEYWTGYSLAYYQWKEGIAFSTITNIISIEDIRSMYPKYHEMDIMQFVDCMDEFMQWDMARNRLKRLRAYAGLSQSQLAKISGVPVRTIQQYEQGQKQIEKASYDTVKALAASLKCSVEKLMS